MNVNLHTRIAQGGMPVIDAQAPVDGAVGQKADGNVPLNVSEAKAPGASNPTNLREIEAPEDEVWMTLDRLDKTLSKLGGALGSLGGAHGTPGNGPVKLGGAPVKPGGAPTRLAAAFNIVAILDLIQQVSDQMVETARQICVSERDHKAALQESTGRIMRQTGEMNASTCKTNAIIQSAMTALNTVFSGFGFREQFKAFAKTDIKVEQMAVKESTDMLKEIKGFKDVAGEGGLFGKVDPLPGSKVEMKDINSQPVKGGQDLFSEKVTKLAGQVHGCEGSVDEVSKKMAESSVKLVNAKGKAGDFKPGDNSQDALNARSGLDSSRLTHEQNRMELREKVDEHINACKEFKSAMENDIAQKKADVANATNPEDKKILQGELTRMQSVYDKECFKMGEGLTKSLNHKVTFTQETLEKSMIMVSNTEEMAWAKGFETVSGIIRQGFETGQGYVKSHGDAQEAVKREEEHLSQAGETKFDSDIDMTKSMQDKWRHTQQMVIDLRKLVADLDNRAMHGIWNA